MKKSKTTILLSSAVLTGILLGKPQIANADSLLDSNIQEEKVIIDQEDINQVDNAQPKAEANDEQVTMEQSDLDVTDIEEKIETTDNENMEPVEEDSEALNEDNGEPAVESNPSNEIDEVLEEQEVVTEDELVQENSEVIDENSSEIEQVNHLDVETVNEEKDISISENDANEDENLEEDILDTEENEKTLEENTQCEASTDRELTTKYSNQACENELEDSEAIMEENEVTEEETIEEAGELHTPKVRLFSLSQEEKQYKQGDKGDHVKTLKQDLVKLGFARWSNPTEVYGSITANVVKQFQKYYNLPETGVADKATRNKIAEVLNPPYKKGDRGEPVVKLKENLVTLGFAKWKNPSMFYGEITAKVVTNFQRAFGLTANGIAGQTTLQTLKAAINGEIPYEKGHKGAHVKSLKEDLVKLGFARWSNPTNVYGTITANVVKQFQDYYGLKVTGVADGATRSKIAEVLNPPYKKGDRGEPVVKLKENLVTLGFANWKNPSIFYGDITAKVVTNFQRAFGLITDGIAGETTLKTLKAAINGEVPYVKGDKGSHVKSLKEDLVKLGFARWSNPTNVYGTITANVVKDFQNYYGLLATGIADEVTRNKIAEVLNPPYKKGDRGEPVVRLKEKLVELGFARWSNPSMFYGDITAKVVKEFQQAYGLTANGIADKKTLEELKNANVEVINYSYYNLTLTEALAIQMKVNPQTDKPYAYVSKNYVKNNKVTATKLNVRNGPCTCNAVVGQLDNGYTVKVLGENNGWYKIEFKGWKTATPDDVLYYLDPTNFVNDERLRFQFLDLSKPSNTSAAVLNKYLKGKGTLEGMGHAFLDASKKHGINDLYLLSHAILETGHGQSELAQGVKVKGKTVYNMFGIGAYDKCAVKCGADRAYEEGWFTPYDAIVGGAKFIGNGYIKAGQNTLYKMRWNPEAMEKEGKAEHQYATDIGWAAKQVTNMYNMYKDIGIYRLVLDIPKYRT